MKTMSVYHQHDTGFIYVAPEDGTPLTYTDARRIADLANDVRRSPLWAKLFAGTVATLIGASVVGLQIGRAHV